MAFSKIVGLEVSPLNPSSSMSFCKAPESSRSRLILSCQTLCPWFCSSKSELATLVVVEFVFINYPPIKKRRHFVKQMGTTSKYEVDRECNMTTQETA